MADSKDTVQSNSGSTTETGNIKRLFPPYLLWFILVPALPFFFSVATLSFIIEPAQVVQALDKQQPATGAVKTVPDVTRDIFVARLFNIDIEYIKAPFKTLTHLSNLLTYFAITAVHGIVCLFVLGFFLYQVHQQPKPLMKRTYLYMGITAGAFMLAAYIVHLYANNLMLTQLGYKSICILMSKAELQTALVWPDPDGGHTGQACFMPEYTRLVWLAYTPVLLGMLSILGACSYTTILASAPIPSDDEQWRPVFLSRIKLLQKSFYLLSLVLVTSTITILHFTSLPLELMADNALTSTLSKFYNSLTAFWGGLFTATLFATFIPAVYLFIRHARNHQLGPVAPSGLGQWLYESVFVSIKKQAMNVLVMIAPMLVGPFSDLLRNLSGMTTG